MSIFDTLRASPILRLLSGRKKKPAEMQAEKLETVEALRRLTKQPDWNVYRRLLDITVSAQVQALLAGQSDSEVHRMRGYIQGLLHSVQLAENLVTQEDNVRDRNLRAAASADERASAVAASLYATGHWS